METLLHRPLVATSLFLLLALLASGGVTAVGVLLFLATLSSAVVCLASFFGPRLALVVALGCCLLLIASFLRLFLGGPL